MGYYTVFTGQDDKFYWNLKAPNHEIICQSQGYTTKQHALDGIASVQKNATSTDVRDEG